MTNLSQIARFISIVLLLCPLPARGQPDDVSRSWNRPVKPFRLIGNIYYVGASEVTSFLITTPEGHILLDSGFAETVPLIEIASLRRILGAARGLLLFARKDAATGTRRELQSIF